MANERELEKYGVCIWCGRDLADVPVAVEGFLCESCVPRVRAAIRERLAERDGNAEERRQVDPAADQDLL